LIQLYLDDQHKLTWNLWIAASQDRARERYWKKTFLVKSEPIEAFAERLPNLLEEARDTLLLWSRHPDEFEFATTLKSSR
jgi:hypothetical protein